MFIGGVSAITIAGSPGYIAAEFGCEVYYISEDNVADLVAGPLS